MAAVAIIVGLVGFGGYCFLRNLPSLVIKLQELNLYLKKDPAIRDLYARQPFFRQEVIKVGSYWVAFEISNRR